MLADVCTVWVICASSFLPSERRYENDCASASPVLSPPLSALRENWYAAVPPKSGRLTPTASWRCAAEPLPPATELVW